MSSWVMQEFESEDQGHVPDDFSDYACSVILHVSVDVTQPARGMSGLT